MSDADQSLPHCKSRAKKPKINKECKRCLKPMVVSNSNYKYCSPECRRGVACDKAKRYYTPRQNRVRVCECCRTEYVPALNRSYRYCSDKCKKRALAKVLEARFKVLGLIESKGKDYGTEQVPSENT